MYGKSVLFSCRVVSTSHSIRYKSSNSTKKLLEFLAEMPKANSTRIAEAQRQRQHIAKKSEKYGPSTVYLQVLGSGARGAPNTLYLFTDQKRYLFNCGECTQRLAHEHKVKLSRLDHIFITSKTWRNIGGLPGLSLTLQDVGVPNITLHGPEGLDELYNATRRFVIMKDMNVTMANCSSSEDFEDSTMNVKYVLLGPHDNLLDGKELKQATKKPKFESNVEKEFEEFIHDETDYYKQEAVDSKFIKVSKTKVKPIVDKASDPQKKKTEKVLHDLQRKTHCSVAYICTLKKRLGTLDLAKCVELGVKPGPMLGQLKAGHDVVLQDGTLVLSKDVKTPDDPGPVFIVLDVPEISYLKDSEFSAHFDNGSNPPENIPALIVHLTPPEVFHHASYRSFMLNFGPTTRHLILNSQNCCLGSEAVHRTQHKLHLLDPDIFPLLRDASVPAVWNTHPVVPKCSSPIRIKGLEELKNKIALAQFQNIINMEGSCRGDDGGQNHGPGLEEENNKLELIAGRTLTTFHLKPKKQLDRSSEPKLHVQDYIQETMDVDGFARSLDHFRRQVEGIRYSKTDCKEFPKVVFLGTGSCIPSKTRNTSAIVLQIDDNRSILLDCGEGTFGQLVRFYGPKRVNAFLRTLKAIYVSHLHADHHIGLIGVLQARRKAWLEINPDYPPEPLYLLAPGQIYTWLSLYDLQFEKIRGDFTLVPNQSLQHDVSKHNNEMTSAVLANIGVQLIQTCLVSHCPNAFGVAIQLDQQYKITYSGDTIPCDELVKIGENSTILIHEATMEDELAEEARMKMHSTTSQAIDMGRQMGARYTVLTHFSQRYARLPRLNPHILNDNHSVGIAFDNMQITMSDLELLPHMYAPLQLMFAEHCVEMELKAANRTRKKERRASSPHLSPDKFARKGSLDTRSRIRSPGCFAACSSPPRARYRESNASRLRQENKGMTVTGIVRRRSSSRSDSSSPSKPRLQSARPKPPECAEVKPTGVCPVLRSHLQNVKPKASKDCSQFEDSVKIIDLVTTPPPEIEISDVVKEPERISSVLSTASTGYVLDTRSKTISNITSRIPTSQDSFYRKRKSLTLANLVQSLGSGTGNGYGKPLVTSLNKKLTVMRQLPVNLCEMKDTTSIVGRGKSPSRIWRNEYKESVSSLLKKKPFESTKSRSLTNPRLEVVTSILIHLMFWRLAHIATYLCPMQWIVLFAIIAVGIFIWTADKGATGTLQTSNTVPKMKSPNERIAIVKNAVALKQNKVQSSTYTKRIQHQSPTRSEKMEKNDFDLYTNRKPINQSSRDKTPPAKKPAAPAVGKAEKKDVSGVKTPRSNSRSRSPSVERKREKQLSEPFRSIVNERVKLQQNKDNATVGRPSASIYSRSFKPQLEDIKSSFMLLNKTNQDHKRRTNEREKKEIVSVHKPKELNEEYRKQQLQQAKKKFQSKHFFHDQKYDKIEGLNWITWN